MNDNGLPDLPDTDDVKKRQYIVVAFVIFAIVALFGYIFLSNPSMQGDAGPATQAPVSIDYSTPGSEVDPISNWVIRNEESIREFQESQQEEKSEIEASIRELSERIKQVEAENQMLKERDQLSPASPPTLPTRNNLPVSPPQTLPLPAKASAAEGASALKSDSKPLGTGAGLIDRVVQPEPPAKIVKVKIARKGNNKKAHIRDTIPSGAFGKAVLLSGLDAPTGGLAERNPHPVLLELIDNGNLPNRYRHKVKQCRVIGSGTGNISDERAYIRLERLSCVLKNGDIISEVATGTVTGEDGKNGLRGILRSKQGQLIANAFLAGSMSGLGNAISQSYATVSQSAQGTVSSIDSGKMLESSVASGIGTSLDKIADWYFKRAEETYPVIEIASGRIVDLFLTEDLPLKANLLANHTPEDVDSW